MIEKRITQAMLEVGDLALTERECFALALPEHSTTLTIELEGEEFGAQWNGRSRHLGGDLLAERLQDYGQDGGLLRLRAVGSVYRLVLLPQGTPAQISVSAAPPTPAKSSLQTRLDRKKTVDRQFHADSEYDWTSAQGKTVGFLEEARNLLGEQLEAAGFDPSELFELRLQGEELATLDDFEELLAVDVANVDRMPHQEAVARHALSRLRGRAILADEVGLGKTIEAGLAVKELTLRGLAKRVLILCPAPLREQWCEEMKTKFYLSFDIARRGVEVKQQDKLILSLTLGRNAIAQLTEQPWDIVIIDEAHRAAGSGAKKTRELITALTTACRYALFLTATPVQNDLLELYRLVELLRPGTFQSVHEFRRQYMTSWDARTPYDPAGLRRLISSAMIRTTRAQAGVDRVVRRAVDVPVDLGPRERELYALSANLLRSVMRAPDDAMRRRSLALRLTASPFSMGTTAFRIAERHSDDRVREVLTEIGHLAMDIRTSAREDKALEIIRDWLQKHGRVLIFTQHTDTVTGLLRRMEAEGLPARAFHGSMSPTERSATVAAFRSGDSPVMISTDAGAEGQNLQFCNCVLNYDLPWNPMRIEQRIGRVDRLTQPRDEVFIANLYARGTVDENVYRLLAEKLRMFELLFGQVTTILGELDDSNSKSFESRVLEAFFADDDTKMQQLLSKLGTELVDARESASTLIAADSGLSDWMTSAFEHRKDIDAATSVELMPEVSERTRMRQRRVQTWVRQVLSALDTTILHDTGSGDGAFMTVRFDDEFTQELGGRTILHLAFDRLGLEHHADAELCAVGSPVFDELLGLLRMRGDLYATVPVIPADAGPTPFQHAPGTCLVRRRLVPSGSWSGNATFRAAIGEAETTEHIITAEINGHNQIRLPRRPLLDGESLPAVFDKPEEVVKKFEHAALAQLEGLRRDRSTRIEEEQAREFDRIRSGYQSQISEAPYDDKERLRRALESEEKRLTRRPDVRARAKALSIMLDEDDWLVEETWSGSAGAEAVLTYEWGLAVAPPVQSASTGAPITVLAVCAGAHWANESETTGCPSCLRDLCSACDDGVFADCPACGTAVCGTCRRDPDGLCPRCSAPERAPELDTPHAIAWLLNNETTLLVGERFAELTRCGDDKSVVLVCDDDVNDPGRARMRSYAAHNDLPPDCGVTIRDLTLRAESDDAARLRIDGAITVNIELSMSDTPGSDIDVDASEFVPEYEPVTATAESDRKLEQLLRVLRNEVSPPAPPRVVVTKQATFTDVYLESDCLVEEVHVADDDGALNLVDRQHAMLEWPTPTPYDATVARAQLANRELLLDRINEAVLISSQIDGAEHAQWIAHPESTTANDQVVWFKLLRTLGEPGGRIGRRRLDPALLTENFPSPTACELVERTIQPTAEVAEIETGDDVVPAGEDSVQALQTPPASEELEFSPVPELLADALLTATSRPFTHVVRHGFEVVEVWRGHGTATHTYSTFDGRPSLPAVGNSEIRESDFGVCRDGHFYSVGSEARCESCDSWACPACDSEARLAAIPCPDCSAYVCRRCVLDNHDVPSQHCLLCNDKPCSGCGRNPRVQACPLCERDICRSCRAGDLCPACAHLAPATEAELADLPSELAAAGAVVLVGHDADATSALMHRGGDAIEHALVRKRSVPRWVVFGRSELDTRYRIRLAASRTLRAQVHPVITPLLPEKPLAEPHLLVHSERSYHASWTVAELGVSGRSTPRADTEQDLVDVVNNEFYSVTEPMAVLIPAPVALESFADVAIPSPLDLVMAWHRKGRDVAVVADGVCVREIEDSEFDDSIARWSSSDLPEWVSREWEPDPTVHMYATSGNVAAAVVGIASMLALGVRLGEQAAWFTLRTSTRAPAATILSRSMGLGDTDIVDAFTDPNHLRLSTVHNATDGSLSIRPIGSITDGDVLQDLTFQAFRALEPTVRVRVPRLEAIDRDLSELLGNQVEVSRSVLEIGLHIDEVVRVDGRSVHRFEKFLAPTETDARRFDDATGMVLDSGYVDREGHFSAGYTQCRYCTETVCPVCVDGFRQCGACEMWLCRRCAREPHPGLHLCPACVTLRRPSRREARDHGRLVSTDRMLIGIDMQHTVVVERKGTSWVRRWRNGSQAEIGNPVVTGYMDQRLERTDST
ncbi:Superfamily II DNA/RNA helicases, SNF2 family [Nocardia nova SH22a]|uniref:Superfamily II DNA/RNA helicases, SNF2 family n=1 Tax=Nocardia nova SH22a TaxID=1415166 RepID=W5TII9_9NOCA|nr:SNF2-related protein [Nocardia nova]AHH17046.1 Superfamily II DNA/RNA helicases, SNF2 family [Nocardia nova SH22a]